MKASSPISLSKEQMRTLGYQAIDLIVEHLDTLSQQPAIQTAPDDIVQKLSQEAIPQEGMDVGELLNQVTEDILKHSAFVHHPRYFAYMPGPHNYISVLAALLINGFNTFAGTWVEASGPTEIELVTVKWLAELLGMPETTAGIFVSGGTLANEIGLLVAREAVAGQPLSQYLTYCSDVTHVSIDQSLKVLGFAPEQLRKIESDDAFGLSLSHFKAQLERDRAAGYTPMCVALTAGTTSTGAIDPLPEIIDFCQREGLWVHVDASYGGALAVSKTYRHLLKGIEGADSVTLDPHKWLFQPFEMGGILVAQGHRLREAFQIHADYLQGVEQKHVNFQDYGPQQTRNFRALKLWLSLKAFGLQNFAAAVEQGIHNAELAENLIRASETLTVMTPACLGIVTFQYHPKAAEATGEALQRVNDAIAKATIQHGYSMVSTTRVRGQTALRMCLINPMTTRDDIAMTLSLLEEMGEACWREQQLSLQ